MVLASEYTPWSSNFFLYMTVKMHVVKNNLMGAVVSVSQVAILLVYLCKEKWKSSNQHIPSNNLYLQSLDFIDKRERSGWIITRLLP